MPEALHLGYEEGYGPYVKVTADQNDDPLTTPDDDFDKYRFNSKRADLTPIREVYEVPYGYYNQTGYISVPRANGYRTTNTGSAATLFLPRSGSHAYNYTPAYSFFVAGNDGWNYPDHWGSYRASSTSGNEWGNNFHQTHGFSWQYDTSYPTDLARYYAGDYRRTTFRTLQASGRFYGFNGTPVFVIFDLPNITNTATSGNNNEESVTENAYLPWATHETPQSGQLFFGMNPTGGLLLARPGYDIGVATEDQLIFGDTPRPLLYFTKRDTLAAGETKSYILPQGTPDDAVCLMQWNTAGASSRFLPSIWIGPTKGGDYREMRWRITNGSLEVQNLRPAEADILLFVIGRTPHATDETQPLKTGIDASGKKYFQFNKGGYTILDTRYAYLPILAHGQINTPGGVTTEVSFPAQNYIPFVLCFISERIQYTNPLTSPPSAADEVRMQPPRYFMSRHNRVDARSFTATVTRSSVSFRWAYSGDIEIYRWGASVSPYKILYFIFGIPNFD